VIERLSELVGVPVVAVEEFAGRGYTPAQRLRLSLGDGRTVFAKVAVNDDTAQWIREEERVYRSVEGPFLPRRLAYDDDPPTLILEDLGAGHWPPPWPEGSIELVLEALGAIAATPPPEQLPSIEALRTELTDGWERVQAEQTSFLALGLCSAEWLQDVLPTLTEAAEAAPIEGDSLLHLDVRSDNICLLEDRAVLVDWNWACVGNPALDIATWLPSLHLEGGPLPDVVAPAVEPGFPALMAGFHACRAGLPPPLFAARGLRELQRALLGVSLPWAARCLGLDPPG
jgi:Phosphotransferase enzyme family